LENNLTVSQQKWQARSVGTTCTVFPKSAKKPTGKPTAMQFGELKILCICPVRLFIFVQSFLGFEME